MQLNGTRTTAGARVELLTWDPVCQRSVSISQRLGQPLHTVHYLAYRRPAVAPIKYPLQFSKTLLLLRQLHSTLTVVTNPPPFAALTAWLHHRMRGGRFVIDAHTGVFLEPKWKPFAPLNRFLMRRAAMTIVTNSGLSETVRAWGGRPFVLPDRLPTFTRTTEPFPLDPGRFNVAAVFSFYEDEPIDALLSLRDLPEDMDLFVTGDSSRVSPQVRAALPDAIHLTGFLDRPKYDALLQQCDAVLVLCTRPHTMLCGAYEAAAAGKPLVTSESAAMRGEFHKGTIFVENSPAAIAAGLHEARRSHRALRDEMRDLARAIDERWELRFADCLATLGAAPPRDAHFA